MLSYIPSDRFSIKYRLGSPSDNRTMHFLEVMHERIYDFTKTRGVGPQLLTTFIEQNKSKISEWSLDNLLQIWNILRWSEIQMSYSAKGFNKGPYEKINKSFL